MPTWWIFTPPSEFLPHLENFITNPKNVRNTITNANTNILVGRKILPPSEFVPPKNYPLQKCFDSSGSCKFYFLENLDVSCQIWTPKFLPQGSRLKARQILSRLVKNISLYFKRRHLIICKYWSCPRRPQGSTSKRRLLKDCISFTHRPLGMDTYVLLPERSSTNILLFDAKNFQPYTFTSPCSLHGWYLGHK